MTQNSENLPAATTAVDIIGAISGIPGALMPSCIKALDRLVGAATDIPAAWLAQKRAQIDAQTQAYSLVEAEIAKVAASEAGASPEIVERAMGVLVRKAYRKQTNREAVAAAAIEDLKSSQADSQLEIPSDENCTSSPQGEVEEDWLNVFERYAEDATSDRMQKLWGRVLSGEIRSPGKFSTRTLRFLSEFSQKDALSFEKISHVSFGGIAPKSIAKSKDDITDLIELESAGLISGSGGIGLQKVFPFNTDGFAFIVEDGLALGFKGKAGSRLQIEVVALTPLGKELISLIPGRDASAAAKKVAFAIKSNATELCYLTEVKDGFAVGQPTILWFPEDKPE
jgi:hypothetical protein